MTFLHLLGLRSRLFFERLVPVFRRSRRLGLMVAVMFALVLAIAPSALAQFSLPDSLGRKESTSLPAEVKRFGGLEVAPVRSPVDNRILFELASPTVYDRRDRAAEPPVEQRAQEVKARLNLAIFNRSMDAETLAVEVSRLNNVTIIDVRDQEHPRPLVLVSVTEQDADYNGLPIDALAQRWRDILNDEIRQGLEQLSDQAFLSSLGAALHLLLGLLGLTVLVGLLKRGIARRQRVLKQRQQALRASRLRAAPKADAELLEQRRSQVLQALSQTLSLEHRLGLWSLAQWLLFWGLVLSWYVGIVMAARQIPGLSALSGYLVQTPLELLLVWFVTGLAIRLSRRIIDRFEAAWQDRSFSGLPDLGDVQRRELRISTIARATQGLVTLVIAITGCLVALNVLGFSTGSVLAIGGLLGLAVSFGSQNLVKDLVNGFLILAEDQYAIGDVIDLGTTAGLVENLNLRVTQLRSADGELVTIPNSAITQVKNLTRSWSRVNFSIDVAYQTQPAQALKVLQEVGQTLYEEPAWNDKILNPPEILGIDHVAHSGMTITAWIKTAPGEQWAVGREFRLRVREALAANGIEVGTPSQTYRVESSWADSQSSSDLPDVATIPGLETR